MSVNMSCRHCFQSLSAAKDRDAAESALSDAKAENARLLHTVAECRNAAGFGTDADPMDVTGWSALSGPEEVPGFIKAQFERLRSALEPFAKRADYFDARMKANGGNWKDDDGYSDDPPSDIYLKQLRDARAALSPNESTHK